MNGAAAHRANERLLCGRLAGLLFLVGSLATIPVHQLCRAGGRPARVHVITALGDRLGRRLPARARGTALGESWFHVDPADRLARGRDHDVGRRRRTCDAFIWFLVFVVVWTALRARVARGRSRPTSLWRVLHVAGTRSLSTRRRRRSATCIAETLIAVPILLVAAGVVVLLRERLTAAIDARSAREARSDALTGVGNYRLLEERLRLRADAPPPQRPAAVGRRARPRRLQGGQRHARPPGRRPAAAPGRRRRCSETVRDQDTVVRQGGDEFCVLAPETDADEARAARRADPRAALRRGHRQRRCRCRRALGFATFPRDATSAELLLAQADLEQRRDKAAGARPRDGVLRASGSG